MSSHHGNQRSLFPRVPTDHSPSPPTKLPAEGHERGEKQKTSGLQHGVIQQRPLAGKTETSDPVTSSGKLLTLSSVEGKAVPIFPSMPQTKQQQRPQLPHFFQQRRKNEPVFPWLAWILFFPSKGQRQISHMPACHLTRGRGLPKAFGGRLDGLVLKAPGCKGKGLLSDL